MDRVERVGISVESGLLEAFDKLIAKQGYDNRSEAVRDLIRDRLAQERIKNPASKGIASARKSAGPRKDTLLFFAYPSFASC